MPTLQNIPGSSSLSEDGVEVNVQIVNRTVEVRVANEFFEKTQIGRTDMSGTEAGQVPVWTGQAWDAGNVTWNSVQDLPAVIAAGDTQQDARDAIGLGTAATADAGDFDAAGTADSAVATHEAKADPHPQYTTSAEAAAAAPVQSVAGRNGDVTLAAGDIAGLGSAATMSASSFATAAQGGKADSALQPNAGLAAIDSAASTKLAGIQAGATANATDAQLRDRATHTGTQPVASIAGFNAAAASAAPVQSVAGKTGAVTLAKSNVGLGNVDNTSDANKPLSTAATAALAEKVTGPASAVSGNVAVFYGSSGNVVKDGGGLGTAAYYPYETFAMNLLSDDGRFDGGTSNGAVNVVEVNFNRGFFGSTNGSTAASAGKFIFENSTFGGGGAALTPTVADLVTAMGLTGFDARRMADFIVCEITSGVGTNNALSTADGTMYLQTSGSLFANSKRLTAGFYIRAISKSLAITSNMDAVKIMQNGILKSAPLLLSPSEGWVFILMNFHLTTGLFSSPPVGLYSTSGGKIQLAMPAFFHGTLPPDTVWKSPRVTRIRL